MKKLAQCWLLLLLLMLVAFSYWKNIAYEKINSAKTLSDQATSTVIYESPDVKVQKYIPFIVIGLGVLVSVGLILLKKR